MLAPRSSSSADGLRALVRIDAETIRASWLVSGVEDRAGEGRFCVGAAAPARDSYHVTFAGPTTARRSTNRAQVSGSNDHSASSTCLCLSQTDGSGQPRRLIGRHHDFEIQALPLVCGRRG
jgi:hypothetical protein